MEDANGDHRAVSLEMTREKLEADSARSISKLRNSLQSPDRPASPSEETKEKSSKDLKLEEKQEQERLKQEQLARERKLFKTAEVGGEVTIEDLFLYFLRAIQRSEKVVIPPCVRMNLILTLIAIFIPSFLRLRNDGWFLGPDTASAVLVVGFWPSNFLCMLSSLSFIAVGGVDMWRRRCLMRSCAAMLAVSREFRRHCPAEVDMLPVLDLSDVNTVAGWRKLRQLCTEWGKFYHLRVRAFSAEFFFFLLIILADIMAGMLIQDYTEFQRSEFGLACRDGHRQHISDGFHLRAGLPWKRGEQVCRASSLLAEPIPDPYDKHEIQNEHLHDAQDVASSHWCDAA